MPFSILDFCLQRNLIIYFFSSINRIDLEPCEMVLSIQCVNLKVHDSSQSAADGAAIAAEMSGSDPEYKSYIIIGTAYALHDEDEPSKGRIIVMSSSPDGMSDAPSGSKTIGIVSELQVRGGVYSMCQFYQGKFLATINSKTQVCQLINEGSEGPKLSLLGVGHHGHILSLFVKSLASQLSPEVNGASDANDGVEEKEGDEKPKAEEEMLAIVGDLMRSISLVQYYPEHETLEEIARDFNANWTTAVEMLSNEIFIGAENWNNLYVLRRNTKAQSDEIRCRLDTVGEFHLGEMCNKFMSGSLVMPHSSSSSSNTPNERASRRRSLASPTKKSSDGGKTSQNPNSTGRNLRPMVVVGSQTLFGTVDGTLGSILGLDGPTAAFFTTLEKSMEKVVKPVGNFSHKQFRAFNADQRVHPSHGFVDGDLVESFLDLDRSTMQEVVQQMNRDGGWELDDPAFSAAGSNDRESAMAVEDDGRPELSVEDVVAVVEEMTMLH
jgi:DNA damage-binding protein 1